MKIALIIGNRPHFIKCAPFLKAMKSFSEMKPIIVHSGQHYDFNLSGMFLKDFDFPPVDVNLNVGSASCSIQTGKILTGLDAVYREYKPDFVVSMGDTNTTLAASLSAYQHHIPNAHIEAGMRENIWRPEEINKKIADHCGNFLFAPIPRAVENLQREGIDSSRIFLTGDITYDTFLQNRTVAAERFPELRDRINLPDSYDLLTMHRAETVDNRDILSDILYALSQWPGNLVFSVHPRTEQRISQFKLDDFWTANAHIQKLPPLSYLDFLTTLIHSNCVVTDSSGVLKEAFYARRKCLVVDDTSEYREIFDYGAAVLGGRSCDGILTRYRRLENLPFPQIEANPFGNGTAADKMIQIIYNGLQR